MIKIRKKYQLYNKKYKFIQKIKNKTSKTNIQILIPYKHNIKSRKLNLLRLFWHKFVKNKYKTYKIQL